MSSDCAVLILSCDKYQDLWKPFFEQWNRFWPTCPYPIYLGSNQKTYTDDKNVSSILSGRDESWASSLISILSQMEEKYILVWLEDAFLASQVNEKIIDKSFQLLSKGHANHIHIKANPTPDSLSEDKAFGIYEKGAPYRINTVGFWNKKTLEKLLIPGESAWNFEIVGSYRTKYDDGYYCLMNAPFTYEHIIEKGKIMTEAVEYCKKNNITIQSSKWKNPTIVDWVESTSKKVYFNLMMKVPWRWRVALMNILRKLIISY